MQEIKFTNVGAIYTKNNEKKVLSEVNSLEWQDLPIKNAPMGQGMALQGVIKEWEIPAKRVAMYGCLSNLGLYGVETKNQQIFFIDNGCEVVPIGLRDLNEVKQ